MTKLTHDQVDEGEDLDEGFDRIVPGDARYSDYHATDAEGRERPFLEWFYDGKDPATLRGFARECAWYALKEAGLDDVPELFDALDPEPGPEAVARHRAYAESAAASLDWFRDFFPTSEIMLEDCVEAHRKNSAAKAVMALHEADPVESAKRAAFSAKGAGVDPYVLDKIAAAHHSMAKKRRP